MGRGTVCGEWDVPPGGPWAGPRNWLRMARRGQGRCGLAFRRLRSLLMVPRTESR
jgi:hypothetical protein